VVLCYFIQGFTVLALVGETGFKRIIKVYLGSGILGKASTFLKMCFTNYLFLIKMHRKAWKFSMKICFLQIQISLLFVTVLYNYIRGEYYNKLIAENADRIKIEGDGYWKGGYKDLA
jgi:phosphatidylglycerophosphate synthase